MHFPARKERAAGGPGLEEGWDDEEMDEALALGYELAN
jgi:hypothetical protein